MNQYIKDCDKGFEIGAGAGFSKFYIHNKNLLVTDNADYDWLDKKVDALNLPFPDQATDFIIESNVLHHLAKPAIFFEEAHRVLKNDGVLILQDVWGSLLLRVLCKILKTEGYSFNVDVFDQQSDSCDPENLWAGNNVIPNLLFEDQKRFESKFHFAIEFFTLTECLIFPLSGGVTSKIPIPELPIGLLKAVDWFDRFLIKSAPNIFALQMQAILRKNCKDY